jgi:hypothetical protein
MYKGGNLLNNTQTQTQTQTRTHAHASTHACARARTHTHAHKQDTKYIAHRCACTRRCRCRLKSARKKDRNAHVCACSWPPLPDPLHPFLLQRAAVSPRKEHASSMDLFFFFFFFSAQPCRSCHYSSFFPFFFPVRSRVTTQRIRVLNGVVLRASSVCSAPI